MCQSPREEACQSEQQKDESEEPEDEPEVPTCPDLLLRCEGPMCLRIWQALHPLDKRALYQSSKGTQLAFAACVASHSLVLKVRADPSKAAGAFQAIQPELLVNFQCRLVRKGFSLGTAFGYGQRLGPNTAGCGASLVALIDTLSKDGATYLMEGARSIHIEGFTLTDTAVPTALASRCHHLHTLTLSHMDLTGPFFEPLSHHSCHSLTQLTLSNVHMDTSALESMQALSALPALASLTMERIQGLKAAGCVDGVLPALPHLSHITHLTLQFHPRCPVKPTLVQLIDQVSHLSLLQELTVHELNDTQYLDGVCARKLASSCAHLCRLEFDRHVIISGVREVLELQSLTSICTRSLEPHSEDNTPQQHQAEHTQLGPPAGWECQSLVGLPCSWQHLSLGAFCPSLTALAALPLHSLTRPFCVGELDLGGHPSAPWDMDSVGLTVRAALDNCIQHCPTLTFTAGKLEVLGSVWGKLSLQHAAPALEALSVLEHSITDPHTPLSSVRALSGLSHIRLCGMSISETEALALGHALGNHVTKLSFGRCVISPPAVELACAGPVFPWIRELVFGQHCTGCNLLTLVRALATRQASAAQLTVAVVKPVGVEIPSELDPVLVATGAGLERCREHLDASGLSIDNANILLINATT